MGLSVPESADAPERPRIWATEMSCWVRSLIVLDVGGGCGFEMLWC